MSQGQEAWFEQTTSRFTRRNCDFSCEPQCARLSLLRRGLVRSHHVDRETVADDRCAARGRCRPARIPSRTAGRRWRRSEGWPGCAGCRGGWRRAYTRQGCRCRGRRQTGSDRASPSSGDRPAEVRHHGAWLRGEVEAATGPRRQPARPGRRSAGTGLRRLGGDGCEFSFDLPCGLAHGSVLTLSIPFRSSMPLGERWG